MADDAGSQAEYQMLHGARVALPLDMDDVLLRSCIDLAKEQLDKMPTGDWDKEGEKVTTGLKAALDAKYGPAWHVIAGKHFGSRVTHETHTFCFFYIGDKAFLIFKCG